MAGQDSLQKHPLLRRWAWKYYIDHSEQCLYLPWHTPWGPWAFWGWNIGRFNEKAIFRAWYNR